MTGSACRIPFNVWTMASCRVGAVRSTACWPHPEITATQAVAMKATGDRMLFEHDRFLSHQDTLYADTSTVDARARQLYRHSTIVTSPAAPASYFLGRPWHPGGDPNAIAQVVIRNTSLPAAIKPAPWTDFSGFSWRDARLFEYRNTGPGATLTPDRPQLTDTEAPHFTIATYLTDWTPDRWSNHTGERRKARGDQSLSQ